MNGKLEFKKLFKEKLDYEIVNFKKKSEIILPDDKHPSVYVIDKGIVKVGDSCDLKGTGTLTLLVDGQCFPLIWGFDHPSSTAYKYSALSEVRLFKVDREVFKQKLSSDVEFTKMAFEMFVHVSWDLMERIKSLQMPYTYEKLVRTLPFIAAKTGKRSDTDQMLYQLPKFLSQDELAKLLGTSRESISKHLKQVYVNKLITIIDNASYVDMKLLPNRYVYDKWFE